MPISAKKKKLIVILFIVAGVLCTYGSKLQGSQLVQQGQYTHKKFFHPYMQALAMFLGQSLCLIAFYSQGLHKQMPLEQGKTPHKKYIFFIPALADGISTTLQYTGLFFVPGSTYMMLKGASIITTAFFSKILLKMAIQKRHIAGCGLTIIGLIFVGAGGFFDDRSQNNSDIQQQILGYILILSSLIFSGFLFAYEQSLLAKHTIHPLQMVGCEGCFGIIIITIMTIIFSFIPCNFGQDGCVYNDYNEGFIQLPLVYFRQIFNDIILLILTIITILTIAGYNFSGVSITKYFDALTRSLLDVTKTSFIWIIGIVITLLATTDQYVIQSLNLYVNLFKAVGFSFIIVGTLIYNRLIFTKYFAKKQSTLLSQYKSEQEIDHAANQNQNYAQK